MSPITLDIPAANEGERYIGTILRADGSGHHIYRLPIVRGQNMTWNDAMAYAKDQAAELPDRVEGALMFASREEAEYEEAWYWTREQHAGNDDYAWCQNFGYGYQSYYHKSLSNRVVLVRRVSIQSSSH
jgi:hypothetical protein